MDPLIRDLTEADSRGFNFRCLATRLATRLAVSDPESARKLAAEVEAGDYGDAGKNIAAILREDADWSEGLELNDRPPLKLVG